MVYAPLASLCAQPKAFSASSSESSSMFVEYAHTSMPCSGACDEASLTWPVRAPGGSAASTLAAVPAHAMSSATAPSSSHRDRAPLRCGRHPTVPRYLIPFPLRAGERSVAQLAADDVC